MAIIFCPKWGAKEVITGHPIHLGRAWEVTVKVRIRVDPDGWFAWLHQAQTVPAEHADFQVPTRLQAFMEHGQELVACGHQGLIPAQYAVNAFASSAIWT
jgi:hypothetical protein